MKNICIFEQSLNLNSNVTISSLFDGSKLSIIDVIS